MNLTAQIAKHFREIHFGGNWTSVNLKETLKDVTWQQATTKVYSFNTIAALVYHTNYYVNAVLKVFHGASLDAHDKYSFDLPPKISFDDAMINTSICYYRFHGVPKLFYSEYENNFIEKIFRQINKNKKAKTAYIYFNNTASLAALHNAKYFQELADGNLLT
jgi:hypothetical protein